MQPSTGNTQPKKNHESRVIRCPNCGHHNPPGQKFCGACGNPLQSQTAPRQNVSPPAAKPRRPSKRMPVAVIVAIIGAIATIIVAVIGIVPLITGGGSAEVTLRVRVTDRDSVAAIPSAKVVLFPEGYLQYTDGDGIAKFTLNKTEAKDARLFVENAQYDISDKNISLARAANDIEIRLTRKDSNDHKIVVRVVDTSSGAPIANATVVFLVGANPQQKGTDSNGLATFTVTFQGDTIDADITVQTADYTIEHQQLTLRPDTVQDMNLDRNTNTLEVADFQPSGLGSSVLSDSESIAIGQTLTGAITIPGQVKDYTFTANANDGILIRVLSTTQGKDLEVTLFGSDGKELTRIGSYAGSAELTVILPESGSYKIAIKFYGPNTGPYTVSLRKTN